MNFILLFILCTAVNVILSTIKSIVTVKGGKFIAALSNAVTYGFYTYVIILTADDKICTEFKIIITTLCNFLGVYIVKFIEEKIRKDRLWKIEFTIPTDHANTVNDILDSAEIPHNWDVLNKKHTLFRCYCATQKQSLEVRKVVDQYDAKWFVTESKSLY